MREAFPCDDWPQSDPLGPKEPRLLRRIKDAYATFTRIAEAELKTSSDLSLAQQVYFTGALR
jgi:hypothetical protein